MHQYYNRILEDKYYKAECILWTHYDKPLTTEEFTEKFRDKNISNTDFYIFIENELKLLESTRAKRAFSNYHNFLDKMKE